MNYRNVERRRVDALRQRAEIAGFEMPASVIAAIQKEDGLRAALMKTREDIAQVLTTSDVVSQLRAEGGLPKDFTKTLAVWREKAATLKEQDRCLSLAIEEQEEAVYRLTSGAAEDLIRTQLQACLAAVVEEVRRHAEAYPNIPWDNFDAAMQLKDSAARDAYLTVKSAHERYDAIRAALGVLYNGQPIELRHEIKNLREVWPNMQFRSAANRAPWPANPVARLAWLVTHGADLWAPTSDEADAEEQRQFAALRAKSGFPPNSAIGVRGPE